MLRRLAPARNLRFSSGRGFSNKPPSNIPPNVPPTGKPKSGGSGVSVVALLATAITVGAPIIYVKTQNVQIDSRLENVIGLMFGTEAVLFLRPTEEGSSTITSYPSLHDLGSSLKGLGSSLTGLDIFGKKAEDALTDAEISEILMGGVDPPSEVETASSSTSTDSEDSNDQHKSQSHAQHDSVGSSENDKNSDSRNTENNSEYSAENNSKQIVQDITQQNTEKNTQHNSGDNTQQNNENSSRQSPESSAYNSLDKSEKHNTDNIAQNSTAMKGNESGNTQSRIESGSAATSTISDTKEVVEEVPLVCPYPPRKTPISSVSTGPGSAANSVSTGPGSAANSVSTDPGSYDSKSAESGK